jgi:hypothetical protein
MTLLDDDDDDEGVVGVVVVRSACRLSWFLSTTRHRARSMVGAEVGVSVSWRVLQNGNGRFVSVSVSVFEFDDADADGII